MDAICPHSQQITDAQQFYCGMSCTSQFQVPTDPPCNVTRAFTSPVEIQAKIKVERERHTDVQTIAGCLIIIFE